MNPRYSLKVEFWVEHGNVEPTRAEMSELAIKVDTLTKLVFGDKMLGLPEVHLCEDEELDYRAYAEVNVVLRCDVNVRAADEMVAHDIAVNMFQEMEESIYLSGDDTGVQLASACVSSINILNIELDSPHGENG